MLYKKPSLSFVKKFDQLVENSKTIVITAHTSPDDDSISSILLTYSYLKAKFPNKDIHMLNTGERVTRYEYFVNYNLVEFLPDIADTILDIDLLICLDGSQFYRFSKKPDQLKAKAKATICIDHHQSPIDIFDLILVNTASPSNVQNIYSLFFTKSTLTQDQIEVLLLGVLGDTGIFAYLKPNQVDTFILAKKLIKDGNIEIQDFLSRYSSISESAFEVYQELIKNTQNKEIPGWPPFTYSYFSREFLTKNNFSDTDRSDGGLLYASNILRQISRHTWGFVVTPKPDGNCNISLRSLPGSVSVRQIMENMKLGGGHDRAAGGTFKGATTEASLNVEECLDQFLTYLYSHKP